MSATRRTFLKRSAQTAAAVALAGGVCEQSFAAQPPPGVKFDAIDCHTHFYDPTRPEGVPWPGKRSPLYRTVLPKDLRELPKAFPITGTVVVEASPWVEDNQWVLDLAKDDPFIVGVVGNLKPGDKEFGPNLKRFAKNPLFRGIRVSYKSVQEMLAAGTFDDFKMLADHDLELDINGSTTTPTLAAQLSAKVPQLRIVVNHIANVQIKKDPPPAAWMKGMQRAGERPQIYCKVSALVEGASRATKAKAPTDIEYYRPYLDVVWDAFGGKRLIYGSNWPVSDVGGDYSVVQTLVYQYMKEKGEQTVVDFFAMNAKRAYKWVDRKGRADHVKAN